MKRITILLLVAGLLPGCKKAIEQIKEDLVIKAMTDGQWKITSFTSDGTNITADFASYTFRYYSDKTVDAINNGTVEVTGSWDGNATAMTTWANFTPASYPLLLINGTWLIQQNSWTHVIAKQTTAGGQVYIMRLDKI